MNRVKTVPKHNRMAVSHIDYDENENNQEREKFTEASMLHEFSSLLERTTKFNEHSFYPTQNALGHMVSKLDPVLMSKLERWDFYEIDQYKLMATDKEFKFKVNKFQRKIEVSSNDAMRYALFSLRLEALKSLKKMFSILPTEIIGMYF